MNRLPEEILIDIFDYLEPDELISIQRTCRHLSQLGRANRLWRYKCFAKSPSASMRNDTEQPSQISGPMHNTRHVSERSIREGRRSRAVNQWDLTAKDEQIDWYSEYKARYAPLHLDWLDSSSSDIPDVRGVTVLDGSSKAFGFLEDSSIRVWDLQENALGRRKFRVLGQSNPDVLFTDTEQPSESLVVDSVSTFAAQQKAFVAVGNVLNEIDIPTLQVVSHSKYEYAITALSQQLGPSTLPLTVGTQWSLHILDPRVPAIPLAHARSDRIDQGRAGQREKTAVLPNLTEDSTLLPSTFGISEPFSADPGPPSWAPGSPSWRPSHRLQNPHWMAYAKVEPGPLSILHHDEHEILIGGRFPSILSYDRRSFPRLQYVIHSSASLSALASIPHSPAGAPSSVSGTSTLIACGEYRGRGSLELYSLPHVTTDDMCPNSNSQGSSRSDSPFPTDEDVDISRRARVSPDSSLFSYKNRQDAARSKLLSVCAHGSRIVFSDSDGGLKWVERDGRSLVRRWNLNSYEFGEGGGSVSGDQVARKIIPLPPAPVGTSDGGRGFRGDSDLLIWTGERMGVVTTNPRFADHGALVKEMEEGEGGAQQREDRQRADEYSKTMRRALERQADERRWMSQFRLKRRTFM